MGLVFNRAVTATTASAFIIKGLLLPALFAFMASVVHALDYPHQPANPILPDISCLSCHDLHGSLGGLLTASTPNPDMGDDNTESNNLCWSCHTGPALAPYRLPHSSDQISQQHGSWNMECADCHNPHSQDQIQTYGSATYLASGTLSAVSSGAISSTLTDAAATWAPDEHAGRLVFPNVNVRDRRGRPIGNLSYRVLSNTATTLTLDGAIDTSYIATGDSYAVIYGKNIRDKIKVPGTNTWKPVKFFRQTGANSFADADTVYDGVCQVCHTRTWHMRNDGSAADQAHENVGVGRALEQNCTELCHLHSNGFGHYKGVTTDGCIECHGHEAGTQYDADMAPPYAAGAVASQGRGSIAPHSTHTESGSISPASAGDDDVRGPGLYCADCHNINNMAFFKTGTDQNGDGFFNLNETDVCDLCHSPDGAYDGVDDPVVGAKNNWRTGGVYAVDGTLKTGKEKWCVGCHDQGTAVINGRQAPDVAGNGTTYGFYVSGHGSKAQECQDCHDLAVSHNFDGQKSYRATLDNYQVGYRLKDVNGQPPMNIPLDEAPYNTRNCNFDENNYRLCLTCHTEQGPSTMGTPQNLFTNTDDGGQECELNYPGTNPYYVGPTGTMITGFRNESGAGFSFGSDVPANGHWDHLVDFSNLFGPLLWKSDDTGTPNSRMSCPACHNPHGAGFGVDTPTIRMTRKAFEISWGTNTNGDYGQLNKPAALSSTCAVSCHFGTDPATYKYYRDHPSPQITSISVVDSNSADPLPAEAGYTNGRVVTVTFNLGVGAAPTQMQCAEDISFGVNATGWVAYSGPTIDYTLSDSDGSKTVYCQLRTTGGSSHIKSSAITLDRVAPTVASNALTAPNGGESWLRGTTQNITWNTGAISDDNLKSVSTLSFDYSTDGGTSFPNSIATGEADDGTNVWTIPADDSTTARVRVSAYDKAGNLGSDSSDANFTIVPIAPALSGISVVDSDSADPAAAEAGYTNDQSVAVTLTTSNFPSQMMLAEDAGFSVNSTGWITYSSNATYTLSAANETKTLFVKVRNGAGETAALSDTITLDTSAPTLFATTLSAPNGGEAWPSGSLQSIVWSSADITDANLKTDPIELSYSADGGSSYSLLSAAEANDGSYGWTLPNALSDQGMVRIVAYDKAGNRSSDTSAATFSIFSSYIVTNTNDSGAESLRQVLTDLIAAGGNGTLVFNIPAGLLTNGVAVINLATALPAITAPNITIDGSSQRSFAGDTNSNGPEVRLNGPCTSTSCLFGGGFNGLNISSSDTLVKGLQFTQFATGISASGLRATLQGNHVGFSSDSTGYATARNVYNIQITSADVAVGGLLPADRNYEGCAWYTGITISGSGAQIINNATGLRPDGVTCGNSYFSGGASISLSTGANSATIQGNIFAGATIGLDVAGAIDGTSIKGNTFGVYYNSASALWSAVSGPATGVRINSTGVSNTVIGGPNLASSDASLNDSNVFDSNTYGINLTEATDYTTRVFGNFIGTNPEQDEVFSGSVGIYAGRISGITIGGGDAGEAGNVIANMSTYGVSLYGGGYDGSEYIEISRNSFYNNGSDSGDDAIFLNGGNSGYSRPIIDAASTSTVTVNGVVSGDVVEVYIADFGGTEYGEGRTFIGSAVASGTSVTVPVSGVSVGQWVTATRAKDITTALATSAFSSNVQIP